MWLNDKLVVDGNVMENYYDKTQPLPAKGPIMLQTHGGEIRWRNLKAVSYTHLVSINYRYISQSQDVVPPVKAPLTDAALALQTVRSKAAEWNIDKLRIGASGGSAGACSSLWLAFHNDMADPKSSDPIARESTRL